MLNSFSHAGPQDAGRTNRSAFLGDPTRIVRRDFTPEQAADPMDFAPDLSVDQEALWKAQTALKHTKSLVEQARKYDNAANDNDPALGKFSRTTDGGTVNSLGQRSAANFQADLTPGQERLDFHNHISDDEGQDSHIHAYFRRDKDCEMLGYKDASGPVEVMVSPNGALTVFTEQ